MPKLPALKLTAFTIDRWVATTPGSWIVIINSQRVMCPKSLCEFDENAGIMTMPEWLAKTKELV